MNVAINIRELLNLIALHYGFHISTQYFFPFLSYNSILVINCDVALYEIIFFTQYSFFSGKDESGKKLP